MQNKFESKLPADIAARKKALSEVAEQQKTLDANLVNMPKKDRVIAYTELTFRRATIEWLIATDQVSTLGICSAKYPDFFQPLDAVEHPTFVNMIQVASRATNGVTIPSRKVARNEIIRMFHEQISALKDLFVSHLCCMAANRY